MEREIMPDYAAEAFYRHLIPRDVIDGCEKPNEEANHCIVFCKKVAPNLFDISKGIAVVDGAKEFFHDGVCMIAPSMRVVFVFD